MRGLIFVAALGASAFASSTLFAQQASQTQQAPQTQQVSASSARAPMVSALSSEDRKALIESLRAETTLNVDEKMRQRQDFYWSVLGGVGTIVVIIMGFLGANRIQDMKNEIKSSIIEEIRTQVVSNKMFKAEIESEVRLSILSAFENRLARIDNVLAFNRLYQISNDMKVAKEFSNAERDAVMAYLNQIKDDEELTSRPDFLVVLENVVDSFFSANLISQIEHIASVFDKQLAVSPAVFLTLLQHFGMRALGDLFVDEELVEQFNKYAEMAVHGRFPEAALPYLMVHAHASGGANRDARIEEYLVEANRLTDDEKGTMLKLISRMRTPDEMSRVPNALVDRIAVKADSFMDEYGDRVLRLNAAA